MLRIVFAIALLLYTCMGYAQVDSLYDAGELKKVTVTAYGYNKDQLEAPTAIGKLGQKELERYSNTDILQAVNNIPGVRMEERSPGSYRFGIRGSAFNAPFGVRNVKVYYNGIPYTEAGGLTYLNQLGYYNIRSLEVIKEPGSSLYGAGTGGVIMINSLHGAWHRKVSLHYTGGSYGLSSAAAEVLAGDSSFQHTIRYQRLRSQGYRHHTQLEKDIFSWDAEVKSGSRGSVQAHFLYGNLHYQTPGGLTSAQYQADPRQARPAAGPIPGAAQNKAAVNQQAFLSGLTYTYSFGSKWQQSTTLYGKYTSLDNPTIRNYSKLSQPGFGGRTVWKLETHADNWEMQWLAGVELQKGYSHETTYDNAGGYIDTLRQQAETENTLLFGFTQLTLQHGRWMFTGGISLNELSVKINTYHPARNTYSRNFNNEMTPRIALLYRLYSDVSLYASASAGYSPPSTEEIVPTGGTVNLALNPANNVNYQAGARGYIWGGRIYFDLTAFYMAMNNAVVQRRDVAGGDHYINAGSTRQKGIEALLRYGIINSNSGFVRNADMFISFTGYHFIYNEFVQVTTDYSGKRMPGVPANVIATGIDLRTILNFYTNLNLYYSDIAPLDDANSISAPSYSLVDIRLGKKLRYKSHLLDVYAGINNLLNERYSLGNDINAFGGRYFNAAAPVNYFAGITLEIGY